MKRTAWIVVGWLVLGDTAQAASFDCAKAMTKVEKFVCDDAVLSKLDEDLNVVYKAALQDKQRAGTIKQTQKQWLKERNSCMDAACVEEAYEARLSALAVMDGGAGWQDTFALSEKARAEIASRILNRSEVTLRDGPYSQEDKKFCNAFLEDFKQQRNVEYIEPNFRTNDYNHPQLVALRNQCPNIKWEWMAPKKCNVAALASWLKGYEGKPDAAHQKAEEMCATLFGEDELALYEIDFGDHKEHVIYQSRTPKLDEDELDSLLRKPTEKELWADQSAWNRRTNTVMSVFFADSGYYAFDFKKCGTNIIGTLANWGATSPESHQGLIQYQGKYFAYNLMRSGAQAKRYGFVLGGRNPVCHFDAVQSKSTKTGSAK